MRGLVLSDIHNRIDAAEKIVRSIHNEIDFTLLLGDLTNLGDNSAANVVETTGCKKCFAMPGNFDSWETLGEIESMGISLHGKSVKLGKFTLIGFGGGLHSDPGKVLFSEEEISKAIEPMLEKAENALLATHLPPKDTPLDKVHSGAHVGSSAVRKAIEKFQPKLHLCGHIHEAVGETKIGSTLSINVGAVKEGNALVLDLGENISFERIKV